MDNSFKVRNNVVSLPLDSSMLALFIGYLSNKGIKASTVSTHLSALAYVHKLFNIEGPTTSPFICRLIQGYHKTSASPDNRLPITIPILTKLVMSLSHVCDSQFDQILLRSMYLTAFFACLRIGEITIRGKGQRSVVQYRHLSLKNSSFTLHFNNFKHNQEGKYHTITVVKQSPPLCPIEAMSDYIHLRGKTDGLLFIMENREPISRQQFQIHFTRSCILCDLPITSFKGHSFRIGAATLAAQRGYSDTQIRLMGRWNSNAFLRYIRFTPLTIK